MPDIVLKDSNGNAQTFTGATGLGVDTVEGGVAVFVSQDLIPEAYTHPATHPASMITELSKVATGGRFADLSQKPFYDLPRLDSTVLAFTNDIEDLSICFCQLSGTWEVPLGESYKVTWDGQEYTCVCKDVSEIGEANISGISYLGNSAKLFGMGWGIDTGEPFIIGFNTQLDGGEYGNATIITTDTFETHTVSIVPVNSVKKLDAKYLPDTVATKDFVTAEIGKIEVPEGSNTTSTDILETVEIETDLFRKQTVSHFTEAPNFANRYCAPFNFPESGATDMLTDSFEIVAGKTYIVEWDGAEYEVPAVEASSFGEGALLLGNGALVGLPSNDEPFAIGWSKNDVIFISITETVEHHTIRIYQIDSKQYVKREYIQGPPEFDLTAIGLPTITLDGQYVTVETDTSAFRAAAVKGLIKTRCSVYGIVNETIGAMSYIPAADAYSCATICLIDNNPFVIELIVSVTAIMARAIQLALPTTT